MDSAEKEEWRPVPVPGFEDLYEVSDLGRVRRSAPGHCTYAGRVLKLTPGHGGYPRVMLRNRGEKSCQTSHVMVATAFHGPCPPGLVCCHEDGDPSNPRATNLRWDTWESNNGTDKRRHGRVPYGEKNGSKRYPERLKRGVDCHSARLTPQRVAEVRSMYASGKYSQEKLAATFGISQFSISKIIRRKSWAHIP